jgi:hypothetical protein
MKDAIDSASEKKIVSLASECTSKMLALRFSCSASRIREILNKHGIKPLREWANG